MTTTRTLTQLQLDTVDCPTCAMLFAIPAYFEERRRDDGKTFYCPQGHPQVFGKGRIAELEAKLATAKRSEGFWKDRTHQAEEREEATERSRRAIKGQLTKVKKRVGNGVCPCCNQTFVDLQRHMAGQHPDFKTEPTE